MRKGFDAFGVLRKKDSIPETTVPGDQTEDEADLAPPTSESGSKLAGDELDGQQQARPSRQEPLGVSSEEVRINGPLLLVSYSLFHVLFQVDSLATSRISNTATRGRASIGLIILFL